MEICTLLMIVGFVLLLDGIFGFIKKLGMPLPPKISAPLGFILVILSLYLNSIGNC